MKLPQIALNIGASQEATFKNYYANAMDKALLVNLYQTAKGRGERFIYFWGNTGSGRTHLLHAATNTARKLSLSSFYLSFKNLKSLKPNALDDLEKLQLICLDDLDLIAKDSHWEEAVFDLFNRLQNSGKRLIISCSEPPEQVGFNLPDLVSRLKSGLMFQIHPLGEKARKEAMIRHAQDKGFNLPKHVADFMITHCERNMGSLLSQLDQLDKASLQAKRKLTIPFVKMILEL